MLAAQRIIAWPVAGAILRHLAAIEEAGIGALELRPDLEDLCFNIESELLRRAGPDVGGQMHTGRSRNDLYAAAVRLWVREALTAATGDLLALREEILALAAEHLETMMPAYTHLQPAQPTTLAHYLAGIAEALGRDAARLVRALETANRSPLGAGATVGTGFPISREQTGEWLGFDGLVENAIAPSPRATTWLTRWPPSPRGRRP
jgi:argininosuccinate lyase